MFCTLFSVTVSPKCSEFVLILNLTKRGMTREGMTSHLNICGYLLYAKAWPNLKRQLLKPLRPCKGGKRNLPPREKKVDLKEFDPYPPHER